MNFDLVVKSLPVNLALGTLVVFTLQSNPSKEVFEEQAVKQITTEAKKNCDQKSDLGSIVQIPCRAAIDGLAPMIRPLLSAATTRENYYLFSIYKSQVKVDALGYNVQVKSIGVWNNIIWMSTQNG
jgi:hypothetical protein